MKIKGFEIIEWTDILYPKTMISDEKSRGGCFIAVPVFGTPPETGLWQKTNLPKHGLVRLLRNGTHRELGGKDTVTVTEQREFMADDQFPWTHMVSSTIIYNAEQCAFAHSLCISRGVSVNDEGPMPLSFGLHPYLATHGEPFEVKFGNTVIADESTDYTAVQMKCSMLGLTLETVRGTVEITPRGYDQWVIWTDDPTKYVCIEPIRGRLDSLVLPQNEQVEAYCGIRYTPK